MSPSLPDCAETFDLEQSETSEDIAFFGEMARRTGGPLLELGCGTGRLAIPLARCGIEVVALDTSAIMLKRFSQKLEHEPPEIKSRIKLIRADMTRFALNKGFRCAICSSNTLLLLASERSIAEALSCVGSHLAPGGSIVIDVAAIDDSVKASIMEYPGGDIPDLAFSDGSGNGLLQRTHKVDTHAVETSNAGTRRAGTHDAETRSPEPASGTYSLSVEYKYFDGRGNLRDLRREDVLLLSPDKLLRLLDEQGYEIVEKLGWYDRRRFSERERKLISVARKRE